MADSREWDAKHAEDAEVRHLLNDLVSEVGASKIPDEMQRLALELQGLIDEKQNATQQMPPSA
ncbi:MAG TPA: hypothetical protein VN112_18855 [Ensifer sp.]|nr:hypothetical protein [Ensifer sp.]